MQGIYAIYDNKAEAIIGGLHLFRNDTAAIRFFGDMATAEKTVIQTHTEDFDLLCLGTLDDINCIRSDDGENPIRRPVLTGKQWLAAQETTNNAS